MVPRRARVLVPAVVVLLLAVQVLQVVTPSDGRPTQAVSSGSVGLVLLVCVPLLLELALRRAARRLSVGPTHFRATPESLTMQTPLGRATVPWSRVEEAREGGGVLVLRTGRPRVPMGMPTASLTAEQRAQVLAWLAHGTAGRVTLPRPR